MSCVKILRLNLAQDENMIFSYVYFGLNRLVVIQPDETPTANYCISCFMVYFKLVNCWLITVELVELVSCRGRRTCSQRPFISRGRRSFEVAGRTNLLRGWGQQVTLDNLEFTSIRLGWDGMGLTFYLIWSKHPTHFFK